MAVYMTEEWQDMYLLILHCTLHASVFVVVVVDFCFALFFCFCIHILRERVQFHKTYIEYYKT